MQRSARLIRCYERQEELLIQPRQRFLRRGQGDQHLYRLAPEPRIPLIGPGAPTALWLFRLDTNAKAVDIPRTCGCEGHTASAIDAAAQVAPIRVRRMPVLYIIV